MGGCWSSWVPCSPTPWWWGWRSGWRCPTMWRTGSLLWGPSIPANTTTSPACAQMPWSNAQHESHGPHPSWLAVGTYRISSRKGNWQRCSSCIRIPTSRKQSISKYETISWAVEYTYHDCAHEKVEDHQPISTSRVCLYFGDWWKNLHRHRCWRSVRVDE